MKREIKFRVWDGKKMLYDNDNSNLMVEHYNSVWSVFCQSLQDVNKDFILMQFTGLKDKNGREIYEGDIVSYFGFYEGDYFEKGGMGFIQWDEEHHYVAKWGNDEMYICSTWDLAKNYGGTVIGNIYENPELLK
jgi:uncharacterized phage protein (TIGR01671 family)